MLDEALLTSVAALAVTTGLLVLTGRRRLGGPRWRALVVIAIGLGTALGGLAAASFAPPAAGVGIALVILIEPRRWYAIGAAFMATLVVSTIVYAAYLGRATLLLTNDPGSLALGLILLALELGAMALILASAFEMVDALCSDSAGSVPPLPAAPERWPVVCIQVPTYNEPPELVIETVGSLAALDYPNLRIQVIDNNTVDEALWKPVEAECRRLATAGHQVEFTHLPTWPGYKAGALNWGREHLAEDVEIVGVVDADYIVDEAWLRATIPYFRDPVVAFVQTPQDYRAWESSAFYRATYVGFAYFFKIGMVSRAHRNAIIFAGTMGLIRRAVLDEVGGWDERIITEDAEISLRVLARGYRSVYVPHPFGRGIMPLTYEGLRKQRFRWAFGGIQILRRHWRTLLGRGSGLTAGQRYDHLMGGLWWFNDALTLGFTMFVLATAVGAIVGRPFIVQRLSGLGLGLPVVLIVLNLIRYLWALRATTGASPALAMAALRVNLSLSWVIALACLRALTQERGVFLRTPKFAGAPAIRELRLVWVETLVGSLAVIALILDVGRAAFAPVGVVLAALLAWAALIYGSATGYALADPARAPFGEGLRKKLALEIAPRVGRVARSRPARAGLAGALLGSFALAVVIASESGRATIEALPFKEVPQGPLAGTFPGLEPLPTQVASPTASPQPSETQPAPSGPPGSPAGPGTTAQPTSSPGAPPTPVPVPTPTPRSTPPVPVPTPTSPVPVPTPRSTPPVPLPTPSRPVPSEPPHPTPSIR
jgi:cellulose synthase/poly-beta-1,6-N-acetylglucosamine synthase-like glycosyltransferase